MSRPGCYRSFRFDKEEYDFCERPGCGHRMRLILYASFVDYPVSDILMATMLNGAAVMNFFSSLAPKHVSQTSEHRAEIMKLENIIIFQNTVDLIKEAQASEHQKSMCLCKKQDINSCLGILLIGEYRCRELSIFSPTSMKIEDCDHVHGVRNLPRFESWHQDRFLWPGTWLDEDTKRNII